MNRGCPGDIPPARVAPEYEARFSTKNTAARSMWFCIEWYDRCSW